MREIRQRLSFGCIEHGRSVRNLEKCVGVCASAHIRESERCLDLTMINSKALMTELSSPKNDAAQRVLEQAKLTAKEVARAEAIVDLALGAAASAMATIERSDSVQMAAAAKETLQVAKRAAADVLNVAKIEAIETLRIAAVLAEEKLDSDTVVKDPDPSMDPV